MFIVGVIVLQEQNRIVAQATNGSHVCDRRGEEMTPSGVCERSRGRREKVGREIQRFGVAIFAFTPELCLAWVRLIVLVDTPLEKWSKNADVAAEDVGSLPAIAQSRRRHRPPVEFRARLSGLGR